MVDQKTKSAYEALDYEQISHKVSETMYEIAISDDASGLSTFDHIRKEFSYDELVYLASVHIASKLKSALEESPSVSLMLSMIRKHMKPEDKK